MIAGLCCELCRDALAGFSRDSFKGAQGQQILVLRVTQLLLFVMQHCSVDGGVGEIFQSEVKTLRKCAVVARSLPLS